MPLFKMAKAEILMWIKFALSGDHTQIFQYITDRLESKMEEPCSNVFELKKRSTTSKGTYFEVFCLMYLEAMDYKVWMLKDLPLEMRQYFNLPKNDKGIDLIALTPNNLPIAIQVKYRKSTGIKSKYKPHGKTSVSWTDLSTFYALCAKTGPWYQHLVMTNCDYISRMGMKDGKDGTIAGQRFKSTSRATWLKMIGSEGHVLGTSENKVSDTSQVVIPSPDLNSTSSPVSIINPSSIMNVSLTQEQLRERRMQYYQRPDIN